MANDQVSINKVFSKSTVPLLLSAAYYLVQQITKRIEASSNNSFPLSYIASGAVGDESSRQMDEELHIDSHIISFRQPGDPLTEVWTNYLQFIAIMLIIHIGLTILIQKVKLSKMLNRKLECSASNEDFGSSGSAGKTNGANDEYLKSISDKIREIVSCVGLLVIQYSLIYCFWCIIYVCIYLICNGSLSMLYTQGGDSSLLKPSGYTQPRTDLPQFGSNRSLLSLPHLTRTDKKQRRPSLRQDRRPDRKLYMQLDSDAMQTMSSLPFEEVVGFALSEDEEIALVATGFNITYVNITDPNSPEVIKTVNISSLYHDKWRFVNYLCFSRDLQVIFYQDSTNSIFTKNLSDPESINQINAQLDIGDTDLDGILHFFPSNEHGLFITSHTLNRFSISKSEVTQLLNFNHSSLKILELSADGTLAFVGTSRNFYILDVSDYKDSADIITKYSVQYEVMYLRVSSSNELLFVLGQANTMVFVEVFDITIPASPKLITPKTVIVYSFEIDTSNKMLLSPDDCNLMIYIEDTLYLYDVSNPKQINLVTSSLYYRYPLALSSKVSVVYDQNQKSVTIDKLWISNDLNYEFISPNPTIRSISTNETAYGVARSSDGKNVYVACDQGLKIFEINGQASLNYQALIPVEGSAYSVALSSDDEIAFVITSNGLEIIDLVNQRNISSVSFSENIINGVSNQVKFIVTPDDKNLILNVGFGTQKDYYSIIDVSNLTLPIVKDTMWLIYIFTEKCFTATQQFFIQNRQEVIEFYNISDMTATQPLYKIRTQDNVILLSSSLDGNSLYVVFWDHKLQTYYFVIFDISNDTIISESKKSDILRLSNLQQSTAFTDLAVSRDLRTAYIRDLNQIYTVNITNKTSPSIITSFLYNNFETAFYSFSFSTNSRGDLLLFTNGTAAVNLVNLNANYAFTLPTQTFFINKQNSFQVNLLKLNTAGRYTWMLADYKLLSMSLYNVGYDTWKSYPPLPIWIQFNQESRVLTINADRTDAIGSYQIYSTLSTKLSPSEFNNITQDTSNLLWILISLGYVDNQYYIQPGFNPSQPLVSLPSPYNASEAMIRGILANHYSELVFPIFVQQSLVVVPIDTDPKSIQIETPSPFTVKVNITIFEDTAQQSTLSCCRFVTSMQSVIKPAFNSKNTTITLEGPLFDVNEALKLIVIDLDNAESCIGSVWVHDGLNPSIENYTITDISVYLQKNNFPQIKVDIGLFQDKMADIPLYTDTYFTIVLNDSLFIGENIQYDLGDKSEDMYWLTLSGLSITGTPPDQLWPWKEYQVNLIASNQYKSTPLPLTLRVKWGLGFVLKLLGKITIPIAIWIYLNIFINILGKKFYRYPREFTIRSGQDISLQRFLPITCIRKELKESRFILKELQKSISRELNSIVQLARYFVDSTSQQINKQKLNHTIEKVIAELPVTKHKYIKCWTSNDNSQKNLLNQLILNELVIKQLDFPQERLTKQTFNDLKSNWTSFVYCNQESAPWELFIDKAELNQQLQTRGVDLDQKDSLEHTLKTSVNNQTSSNTTNLAQNDGLQNTSFSNLHDEIDIQLIHNNNNSGSRFEENLRINFELLNSALLAHAYREHHLDADIARISIVCKEKTNKPWWLPGVISRFLKLNLRPFRCTIGDNIGFGIRCNVKDNVVSFFGTADRTIEGKIIVIEISKGRRIMREIWINGVGNEPEREMILANEIF